MKRLVVGMGAIAMIVGVFAEDVFVGFNEEKAVKVDVDQTLVQSGLIDVEPGGGLYKTGLGIWQVPFASLSALRDCCFGVMGGELRLTDGSASLQTDAGPIMNKAAFWVKTDYGIVETNASSGPVASRWLDAREVDLTAPYSYPYAEPIWSDGQESDSLYGVPPAVTMLDDAFKAVYFGGYGRPQGMHWTKPDGETFRAERIQHVFAVMTLEAGMGQLIGADKSPIDFHRDLTGATYFSKRDDEPLCIAQGTRTYLNGALIDAQTRRWAQGRQLLELNLLVRYGSASRFFSMWGMNGRNGGDYLHEFLVFTNRLTALECATVRNHLMDKWKITRLVSAEPGIVIADGATVKGTLEGTRTVATLSGDGTYIVSGGMQIIPAKTDKPCNVGIRVENGTGLVRSPLSIDVREGDKVTAVHTVGGVEVSHVADGADPATVKQTGDAIVSLLSVPEDVKVYRVDGGTLRLTASSRAEQAVDGEIVEAEIPNPSFEEGKDNIAVTPFTGTTKNGWTAGANAETGKGYVCYYNRKRAGGSTWPTSLYSPDGDVSLSIKEDGWAFTKIHIPTSGIYRLSFKVAARNNLANQNHIEVLIGTDESFSDAGGYVKLGQVFLSNEIVATAYGGYSECCFKVRIDKGGDYYLRLQALPTKIDGMTHFDDFRMRRIAAVSMDYEIPNGGFELCGMPPLDSSNKNITYQFYTDCRGWEFDQGPFTSLVRPAVGVIHYEFKFRGDEKVRAFTSADFPYGRQALGIPSTGGIARTTFTPPAGRYVLVADGKCQQVSTANFSGTRWGDTYDQIPEVKATVTIDGERVELGACRIANHNAQKLRWPKSFTVRKGAAVTLELEQLNGKAIAILDDFRLSSNRADCNLIQNGSFEKALDGNWILMNNKEYDDIAPNWENKLVSNSGASVRIPEADIFGSEGGYGDYVCNLCQIGSVEQMVTFPEAGVYELRFVTRSRPNGPYGSRDVNGRNPIRAWYSRDNGDGSVTTNVIGWTSVENTNFVAHAFQFRVAEAGEYTFALQGMNRTVNEANARNDRSSMVDGVSVTYAANAKDTPDLHENLSLVVAGGNSRLILDYPGTQEVFAVRIGGRSLVNEINATTCPGLVEGIGTLYVRPRGTIITVR